MRRRLTLPVALLAVGALALPAGASGDDDGKSKTQRGEFTTLPDGTAMGLTIEGVATI